MMKMEKKPEEQAEATCELTASSGNAKGSTSDRSAWLQPNSLEASVSSVRRAGMPGFLADISTT